MVTSRAFYRCARARGALIEYAPKEYFRGALYCGNCGKAFKLTRLDDFVEEARDEEKV